MNCSHMDNHELVFTDMMDIDDPDVVHVARFFIMKHLASDLKAEFLKTVENNKSCDPYIFDHCNKSRPLTTLVQNPGKHRDDVLADFYIKWEHYFLVVNKWFGLQAISNILGNAENVCLLIGGFHMSPVNFHAKDGSGYKFLGKMVLQLEKLNPQVASVW
ncbi:hypothetical protein MKW98_026980 [Papaver atlanticum]|uniref:Peptidase M1 alanyl aminopeptidase C-terminal domain-containing protein n=1 Tax=Papaver atlanticum TaxID=357466 RepID=A0AAD4SWQ2_9MAGN|nr:hypothetical protein MKW98_026980 [Papaver atlanticum]